MCTKHNVQLGTKQMSAVLQLLDVMNFWLHDKTRSQRTTKPIHPKCSMNIWVKIHNDLHHSLKCCLQINAYYHEIQVVIQYFHDIAISFIAIFSCFLTAKHFPKVQLCQHFQFLHFPLIIFYWIFYHLTSEHLAPSSGLKSQLIFIILLYRKLSLYLQHSLRIYFKKYQYLVSINWYNTVMQKSLYHDISFFSPHPYYLTHIFLQ